MTTINNIYTQLLALTREFSGANMKFKLLKINLPLIHSDMGEIFIYTLAIGNGKASYFSFCDLLKLKNKLDP
ncbi:hypothetical protein JCM21142_114565 [Saccharicrinis fermentans DSM 9555 = JCM 21142]|uniref:Uncharacterized protein n=1 Tax=Saccharicrinis fermentans DSM 9555 = JCM 21142 TaxID=869213 RepID=W7YMB3_9BACT|nr:hypothetical protein JCM21142_114565 [Saccharicrinis fermentans DSM 9555 = JCM 21142]